MTAVFRTICLSLALSTLSWGAWAHGGEDHGDAAEPVASVGMAPRASAQTEDFELVAHMQGNTLIVTLDRFATNAPVSDAQIEVEWKRSEGHSQTHCTRHIHAASTVVYRTRQLSPHIFG